MSRSARACSCPLAMAFAALLATLCMAGAYATPAPVAPSASPSASGSTSPSPAPSPSDVRGYPLPTRAAPTRPPGASASPGPTVRPSPPPRPVHASPALPTGSRLRVAVHLAYETRGPLATARGESEWRYEIANLRPVWSAHGASTYLADGGAWQGAARASGVEKPREGPAFTWYYAFSRRFPLDRVSGVFPGFVDNLTLYLGAEKSGRVRYRFVLRGNGARGGATNDTFLIERHVSGSGVKSHVETVEGGWVPTLMVGALPGEKPAARYASQGAMAGIVVWRRPQYLASGGRLEGQAAFTHREGATTYRIQIAWTSR